MTTDPELARIVRSWLEDGVTSVPDRVLDSVMAELPATPQRRRWMPAWRDFSMNTYARLAAVVAVVSILAIGGIAIARPGLIGGTTSPTPSASPASSPSGVLPLAPVAWCDYVDSLGAIAPEGPSFEALEAAGRGDLADWRRLGPEVLALGQQARSDLGGLEGAAPIAEAVTQEANALNAWLTALEDSFAEDAGVSRINQIYDTWDAWQANRSRFVNAMRSNYETACP